MNIRAYWCKLYSFHTLTRRFFNELSYGEVNWTSLCDNVYLIGFIFCIWKYDCSWEPSKSTSLLCTLPKLFEKNLFQLRKPSKFGRIDHKFEEAGWQNVRNWYILQSEYLFYKIFNNKYLLHYIEK